jgi:hypothetical protein
MDTMRGVVELVEAQFGECILARDDAVAVLSTAPGLGPPDLCFLQKGRKAAASWVGLGAAGGEAPAGYYHWVLGRDVSSSAALAAYFALITSKQEKAGVLAGLWGSPEWSVQRSLYSTYDPFARLDVRCEVRRWGGGVGSGGGGGGLCTGGAEAGRRAGGGRGARGGAGGRARAPAGAPLCRGGSDAGQLGVCGCGRQGAAGCAREARRSWAAAAAPGRTRDHQLICSMHASTRRPATAGPSVGACLLCCAAVHPWRRRGGGCGCERPADRRHARDVAAGAGGRLLPSRRHSSRPGVRAWAARAQRAARRGPA